MMSHKKRIERIRQITGYGLEFLTATHIEARYCMAITTLKEVGFPAPMSDGRWRATDVDAWFDAIDRELASIPPKGSCIEWQTRPKA
jgi:hypothetical protein